MRLSSKRASTPPRFAHTSTHSFFCRRHHTPPTHSHPSSSHVGLPGRSATLILRVSGLPLFYRVSRSPRTVRLARVQCGVLGGALVLAPIGRQLLRVAFCCETSVLGPGGQIHCNLWAVGWSDVLHGNLWRQFLFWVSSDRSSSTLLAEYLSFLDNLACSTIYTWFKIVESSQFYFRFLSSTVFSALAHYFVPHFSGCSYSSLDFCPG